MMMTFTIGTWIIPTLITIISIVWAYIWGMKDDNGGYLSGLGVIFALVPALFVSCVAWIIYAVCK
jgi:hypothetical protein